ncbi:MAG: PA0069 family radical SAM protein [Flavobacteriaceae bacterium]
MSTYIKGRGAQHNTDNKFLEHHQELRDDFLNYCAMEGDEPQNSKTVFIATFSKTIVNKVTSPDIGMGYSLNPYQGCEHGCVYCYARNSHEYWGYNAGLDFEQKILVKKNAPELLEKHLQKKNWVPNTIVLSGNTDCYQPIEKKLEITRELLKVFLKYKHPVGIITKNALIQRDMDILEVLAKDNLIHVSISITSLDESTRRILEPRTASIKKRLETVEVLTKLGVPVNVMMAPIIPAINSHDILPLVEEVAKRGAVSVGHTIVRLNGSIGEVFTEWIKKTMPDRAEKVLHQIAACHGGTLNNSQYGRRIKGEGNIAEQIHQQFAIARKKFLPADKWEPLNTSLYASARQANLNESNGQMKLF